MSLTQPPLNRVVTYSSRVGHPPKSYQTGKGFQALSFEGEQKVLNKEWAARLTRAKIETRKILSETAKSIIVAKIQNTCEDGPRANEPPFMKPSTDPDQYSQWCSFCNDFADLLLLCAGCRVGLCSTSPTSTKGCVVWDPRINNDDFVFYCPYCITRLKQRCPLKLKQPNNIPKKTDVFFRCDPAVLIVSIRWHETKQSFGKLIRDHLLLSYANNEESIMLVETSLNSLKAHRTAKIVIVIDTHCIENGFFIYKGDSPENYAACSLLEILRDSIPGGIFKYISDAAKTPKHSHKSLILNLACGASISQPDARNELLHGHCADAILSLANETTVVGDVSATLLSLVACWVQTPSDYDVLIAKTITEDWAKKHLPVLSRRGHDPTRYTTFTSGTPGAPVPITLQHGQDDHILYTKLSLGQPAGKLVLCHVNCGQEVRNKPGKNNVRLICQGCGSRCSIDRFGTDKATVLGRHGLVAVKYPQDQHPVEWKLFKDNVSEETPAPSPQEAPKLRKRSLYETQGVQSKKQKR